ncbi:acyltransferase [Streptomyces sp. H27-G5]|uniref:acyltransferase family protein n=2 Tax=unclassified Streptomyces TaxID=2593676 RepID=UPI0022706BB2|nr:acyltransferase [Streptomyces sp. H27-G5]MCY0923824.1 acyltransferase [Streptomyces sp. H27-G5]
MAGIRTGGQAPVRLYALDAVRITAALVVVLYHYVALGTAWGLSGTQHLFPALRPFALYGWLGVEIFFIVSGFVICMSAWGRTVGDFATSRISRLFPAYWAGIAFTTFVLWMLPELWRIDEWADVLVNFTMFQGGIGVPHLDHAYWTLFEELKFYALFALVIRIGVTYRNCVVFIGLWTVAGVVAPSTDFRLLHFFAIPQYSPYFIAGVAFYLMRRFRPSGLLWGIVGCQFLLAQHYVRGRMVTNLGARLTEQLPAWPARIVIAVGFLAMAAIALGLLDRIQWSWLSTVGAITYPLYIIHMTAGITLIHHFRGKMPAYALVGTVTAAMLVVAWLIHRFVERPLSRRLRSAMRSGIEDIRRSTPVQASLPPSALPAQRRERVVEPNLTRR